MGNSPLPVIPSNLTTAPRPVGNVPYNVKEVSCYIGKREVYANDEELGPTHRRLQKRRSGCWSPVRQRPLNPHYIKALKTLLHQSSV